MKMRSLIIDAGSVILYKKYNPLRRLWSKITRKDLPFNMFTIVGQKTELLTTGKLSNVTVYEPIKKYSKAEGNKLFTITFGLGHSQDWDEIVTIINLIRPNTLDTVNTIDKSKYYKKVEWNEKLDEYIY